MKAVSPLLTILFLLAACRADGHRKEPAKDAQSPPPDAISATAAAASAPAGSAATPDSAGTAGDASTAAEEGEAISISIEPWLLAGPLPIPSIAFGEGDSEKSAEVLLSAQRIASDIWPREGERSPWLPGRDLEWRP
ncbi:MAG: hypothetical protein JXA90_00765, partial [Planctomycetes bacterium]|nr:hypothetical protein [Planctomycetota bacterium]